MVNENRHSPALQQVALELKNARARREMTIDDVSKLVRIRRSHIEKLEEGDFSFLPSIYVFAYIRKYAAELGLKDTALLEQCRHDLQIPNDSLLKKEPDGQDESPPKAQSSGFDIGSSKAYGSGGFPDTKAIVTVTVVIAAIFLLFFVLRAQFSAKKPVVQPVRESVSAVKTVELPAGKSKDSLVTPSQEPRQ
jgi:cytoskeletal protein RodZ